MAFKRATWHSGLTYRQTCNECKNVVTYRDDALDFRPWYADGFIYCPNCKTPLRHNEVYAIDNTAISVAAPAPAPTPAVKAAFCTQCGTEFRETDRFCGGCGAKRQ